MHAGQNMESLQNRDAQLNIHGPPGEAAMRALKKSALKKKHLNDCRPTLAHANGQTAGCLFVRICLEAGMDCGFLSTKEPFQPEIIRKGPFGAI